MSKSLRNMNIFAVGAYPPRFGGGQQAGWNIAKQLARLGHKITIFTEAVPGKTLREPKNLKVIQIPVKRMLSVPNLETYKLAKPLRQIVGLGGGIARKPFTDAISKELKKSKPDAIMVNFNVPYLSFVQNLAKKNNIALVSVFHGSDVHNLTTSEFATVKKTIIRSYHNPDAKISVSNYLKNTLQKMGVNGVTVIPNAIDMSTFKPGSLSRRVRTKVKLGIPKEAVLLTHVSTLRPIKRPMDIVEAAAIALQKAPNLHFLIVGNGPLKPVMINRLKELGIAKKFTFTGMVSQKQVNLYLNASNALLLPSQREGMPLVILESFACGKPVIASNVGGIPEIVKNGRNGLLVEPGNISQLANRMALMSGKSVRTKLYQGALETAKGITLKKRAREYAKVIRSGIRRKRKQQPKTNRLKIV